MQSLIIVQRKAPAVLFKSWLLLCILFNAVQQPRAVRATDDVVNVSACELESIINQLINPNSEYQMHASALRRQLKNLLRDRQLAVGEEQTLNDYDYTEEDKRSVAALAAQGLLHPGSKRSLATLAKNGQLPTPVPEESTDDNGGRNEEKRYIGSLARSGSYMGYGKRNVGTLARDFQLPQNGKRNMATLARLGLLGGGGGGGGGAGKRNVASVARYNSKGRDASGNMVEKRNLGALKGSPVHGAQQKREEEDYMYPSMTSSSSSSSNGGSDLDYIDAGGLQSNWWYPNYVSYADLDWGDFGRRAQKRFLDTSKDPELFGIENAAIFERQLQLEQQKQLQAVEEAAVAAEEEEEAERQQEQNDFLSSLSTEQEPAFLPSVQKRHIGAVYRSGFLPSYRALRSTIGSGGIGGGGGRFSRSGRARQFVEYFPQRERLRQPTAAVCRRCFLPSYRPVYNWGINAPVTRGRIPKYIAEEEYTKSITTNSLPTAPYYQHHQQQLQQQQLQQQKHHERHPLIAASSPNTFMNSNGQQSSWGTPPRLTALQRRGFRRQDSMENFA